MEAQDIIHPDSAFILIVLSFLECYCELTGLHNEPKSHRNELLNNNEPNPKWPATYRTFEPPKSDGKDALAISCGNSWKISIPNSWYLLATLIPLTMKWLCSLSKSRFNILTSSKWCLSWRNTPSSLYPYFQAQCDPENSTGLAPVANCQKVFFLARCIDTMIDPESPAAGCQKNTNKGPGGLEGYHMIIDW